MIRIVPLELKLHSQANYDEIQALNGPLTAVKAHMDGLEQIVKMRGGINKGDLCPAVQRLVLWYECQFLLVPFGLIFC